MTTRDPGRYPRSAAYATQPDLGAVCADALLLNYAHCWLLTMLVAGHDRRRAYKHAAAWFFHELLPTSGERWGQIIPVGEDATPFAVRCLAEGATHTRNILRMDWTVWHWRDPASASAQLQPTDRDRAVWLAETTRRVAQGQHHLGAARAAHDAHLGKPRQQRTPADPDWLAAELATATTRGWWALLQARTPTGGWFLHLPQGTGEEPPRPPKCRGR